MEENYIKEGEIISESKKEIDKDAMINFYVNRTMPDINGKEVTVPVISEQVSVNMLEARIQMALSQKAMAERQIEEANVMIKDTQEKLDKINSSL